MRSEESDSDDRKNRDKRYACNSDKESRKKMRRKRRTSSSSSSDSNSSDSSSEKGWRSKKKKEIDNLDMIGAAQMGRLMKMLEKEMRKKEQMSIKTKKTPE